jgi:hypothetical protein
MQTSLKDTGIHLGSGIAGMLAGSAVGRHSLWLGVLTLFGSSWYRYDWLTSAGVAMIASNGFGNNNSEASTVQGMDGFQDELTLAKERAIASLKALGKKTYLDKFSPDLAQKLNLGTLEDSLPVFVSSEAVDFDTQEVDEIIRQLESGESEALLSEGADVSGQPIAELEGGIGNLDIRELDGTDATGLDAMELNAVA